MATIDLIDMCTTQGGKDFSIELGSVYPVCVYNHLPKLYHTRFYVTVKKPSQLYGCHSHPIEIPGTLLEYKKN